MMKRSAATVRFMTQRTSDLAIRELQPGDRDTLLRVFEGLTEEQRILRYGSGMPRLMPSYLDQLTATDGLRHVALAADVDGLPVGIARYIVERPGTADFAIEVVDACTRRGIARVLLGGLTAIALQRGVSRFTMDIMGVNAPALGLARAMGAELRRDGSSFAGVVPLEPLAAALPGTFPARSRRLLPGRTTHAGPDRLVVGRIAELPF
jgi:GNAT superfamily N-acetyltransferase